MASRITFPSIQAVQNVMQKEASILLDQNVPLSPLHTTSLSSPSLGFHPSRMTCFLPGCSDAFNGEAPSDEKERRLTPITHPSKAFGVFSVNIEPDFCSEETRAAEMPCLMGLAEHFTSIYLRGFTPFREHESVGMGIKTQKSEDLKSELESSLSSFCLPTYSRPSTQRGYFYDRAKEGTMLYCLVHISRIGEASATTNFQLYAFDPKSMLNSRNDNLDHELYEALRKDAVFPVVEGGDDYNVSMEKYFGVGRLANWMVRRISSPFALGSFEKKFLVGEDDL